MAQGELTYFLKCNEFVKIGKTNALKARVDDLQHANPYELELLGVSFKEESEIHEKFAYLRGRGEWFHLTTELKEYISENAACPDSDGKLTDMPIEDDELGVLAVGKSRALAGRIKSIRDIVKELQRETGSARFDTIIERASKLGFEKDKVEAEIARLVQEAAIFEPVRYSRNYRISQQ